MDFGFFVRLRCFLRVDHVILKCIETRYYHEFDKKYILRETRQYQDSYDSFIAKCSPMDRNDVDVVVSTMEMVKSIDLKPTNFTIRAPPIWANQTNFTIRGLKQENPLQTRMSFITSLYNWKQGRDLPFPGTFENLHRECRNVSLTPFLFDGAKADLAKGLSANFQVSHSFSLGSMMMPPSYHFGGIYVAGKHLLHGLIDTNGIFQGKYHYTLTKSATLKAQAQLSKQPGQSMVQLETDFQGADCSVNIKAINPDISESASGIYTVSMLQSLSKHFSAGLEVIAQKATQADPVDIGYNVAARYSTDQWTTAVNLQQLVALQASYFHKVNERVELGTELQMLLFGPRRDAVATMGAKFDYRQALIRTQIDSTGKVGLVYEERLFPGFSLILSGELDHVRNASRFGFGINLEN